MRVRSRGSVSGSAMARFAMATRRSRGKARSSARTYPRARKFETGSGAKAIEFSASQARPYSTASRSAERWRMNSSFYPSAAENKIAIVENRALPGGDGALRLVETHLDPVGPGGGVESGRGGVVPVADLHLRPRGCGEALPRDPIDVARDKSGAIQTVSRPDGHALRCRVG